MWLNNLSLHHFHSTSVILLLQSTSKQWESIAVSPRERILKRFCEVFDIWHLYHSLVLVFFFCFVSELFHVRHGLKPMQICTQPGESFIR